MKKYIYLSIVMLQTFIIHADNLPFGYIKISDILARNESGSVEFHERMNALQIEVQKMAGELEAMQQEHETLGQELQNSEKAKLLSDAAKRTKAQRIMQIEREISQR